MSDLLYIQTGERIDGENAPDSRSDVLNRPLKLLLAQLQTGDISTSAKNTTFKTTDYTVTATTDSIVYYNTTSNKIENAPYTSAKLGFYNSTLQNIYTDGEFTFTNRNDLQTGEKYYMSKAINGSIVTETDANASNVYVGTATNSNKILINLGYILPHDSDVETLINNVDSITNVATNIANVNLTGGSITNVNNVATNIDNINLIAPTTTNINVVATNIDSINNIATNIDDITNISDNVAVVSANVANVNNVGNNISNVNLTGGSITNVNNVGNNITNVNTVATNLPNINTVATNITKVNTVSDSAVNVNIVGNDLANSYSYIDDFGSITESISGGSGTSNINTVATNIANVNLVGPAIANVNNVGNNITNVNTVATNITKVNTVSDNMTKIANVNTNITPIVNAGNNITSITNVSNNLANISTANSNITNINTTATNISNVNNVGNNIASVNNVSSFKNDIVTTAGSIANVNLTGGSITNVNTVATNLPNINTVATNIANVNLVGPAIANVNNVGNNITNVNTVATNLPNINTVATNITKVNTVSDSAVNVNIVGNDLANSYSYIDDFGSITESISGGSGTSNINTVATNIANVNTVSDNMTKIATVSSNIDNINTVSSNITSIQNAEANASLTLGYKNDVSTMKLAIETIYDTFDDRFLGTKTTNPLVDNDGNALIDGALYFDTTTNAMKVYDVGTTTWYSMPQIYLNSLLDVELTSLTTGHILVWNGTKWANGSLSKSSVGLGSVDNTADSAKNVLSATKLATARLISLSGDVTGSASFDGSGNISINTSSSVTGTFTPYLVGVFGGEATYEYALGTYTKINNLVYFDIAIKTLTCYFSTAISVAGLPFVRKNTVNEVSTVPVYLDRYTFNGSGVIGQIKNNTSEIYLSSVRTGNTPSAVTCSSDVSSLSISGVYPV